MNNTTNKKPTNSTKSNPLWGGRFEKTGNQLMEIINASINYDQVLYRQDIKASIIHTKMLAKQNIISQTDSEKIINGLMQIEQEIEQGDLIFRDDLEDIHMNIEFRLKEIIGPTAGKLHTARSRNDQVATDFKLWVRQSIDIIISNINNLQDNLIVKSKEYHATIMPGYTHLQTAQPVTFGHHLHAYFEMLERDKDRFNDVRKRLNYCPLGAAALAGTSFNIDRHYVSDQLEFTAPTNNSLDTVSDRDFAIEYLSAIAIMAMHLSRFAEEIVIWTSADFNFIKLPEEFTSGSSIMPQKRNPDAAEIIRAKTGRLNGALISLLTMMKGLPLAYCKDMQEDKEPVFDATNNILICVKVMSSMVEGIIANEEKMLQAAKKGFSTATDLADWLVKQLAMPFREAHHVTGQLVKLAEDNNIMLDELSITDMQNIEPKITEDIYNVLSVENSITTRNSYGGTAPNNVINQLHMIGPSPGRSPIPSIFLPYIPCNRVQIT
ncbi:MAG: argininosuccinate lyase, partial [Pseudomonadota bacterium]